MKCLIIEKVHHSLIPLLENLNISTDYFPNIKKQNILEIIGNYEIIFLRNKIKVDNFFCQKATKLRIIARIGAGLDEIDQKAAKLNNIIVINAPEGNKDSVAEHTVAMILCLLNKIHLADQQVRQKQWLREENRGIELQGKTVAIIGYGNMGSATAKRLSGFNCNVIAYDKFKTGYGNAYVTEVSLEQIYEEADIVSLHIPLLEENLYWIDENFIRKFKKKIYLINIARGKIIKLEVIKNALESGKIVGACLDVLENEQFDAFTSAQQKAFDYLKSSPKLLFTPHVGGWTYESYKRLNRVLVNKIKHILQK